MASRISPRVNDDVGASLLALDRPIEISEKHDTIRASRARLAPTDTFILHGNKQVNVILPKFGMRKKTRSVVSGLLIAVASLIALAYAYEEARANMLRFFVGTVVMILVVLVMAATTVATVMLVRKLGKKLRGSADDDSRFE